MVLPDSTVLSCLIGFSWAQEFDYFDDDAQTQEHDFTGYDVSFSIVHQSGTITTVTTDITGNSVLASMSPAETAAFSPQTAKYVIRMTDQSDPTASTPLGAGYFSITKAV